jgi:predicted RNA-binding Zn-ribbon protein involved in translation (DUF1610 family)
MMDAFGIFIWTLALTPLYLIPTFVAATRRVSNVGSVVVVNLFLGWTCIGWIVALAMAWAGNRPAGITKKCPACAETVLDDAKVCRYCGRDFPTTKLRCNKCKHVQAVLANQTRFTCEQCGQHLMRPNRENAA